MGESDPRIRHKTIQRGIRRMVMLLSVTASVFFLSYGRFDWWQAWLLLAFWLVYYLVLLTFGMRRSPDVLIERSESFDRDYQPWDKWIIPVYTILSFCLYLISGLDAGRYGWSLVPEWVIWVAFVFVIPVYVVPFWAVMSNPFASGTGRIQSERGHHVVSAGPYRFVRHPMYSVMIAYGIAFPLFLGSYWALIPGGCVIVLFTLRTYLEDEFLQENLDGYEEYAKQVRWCLLPGVW